MQADKRKIIVVFVLLVALLAVGVWQFMGTSSPSPEALKVSQSAKKETKSPPQEEPQISEIRYAEMGLVRKDPFQTGTLPEDPSLQSDDGNVVVAPPEENNPPKETRRPPIRPNINTSVPLFDPNQPGTVKTPAAPARSPDEFTYTLIGIVEGPNPVAVFQNDSGQQKMVPLNSFVEKNSRVVAIRNGKVTVRHNGKTLTFSVGGKQ